MDYSEVYELKDGDALIIHNNFRSIKSTFGFYVKRKDHIGGSSSIMVKYSMNNGKSYSCQRLFPISICERMKLMRF